ncbi:hypothetical protein M5K25_002279 [Dendrobium thyrsiflorum]|uniref:Uncharacterized protein n=1 Tax=Dendrobium thyrsiflorum TaxID=117978 RepID=A0ABD0VS77_DENTH
MSPNKGPEALLEGSNHDLDYQTVSKLDKIIVESSGSTRRIQRAKEHRIPTSLSQKIIHRTVYDQRIQHRPSIRTTPHLPLIYKPCHSRKSINRAPPPPEGPTSCRTIAWRPDVPPDHHLKARRSAQGPTLCPRPDVLSKARRPAQGPTLCSRPDALLKARRSAQDPTSCSRPDVLPKA